MIKIKKDFIKRKAGVNNPLLSNKGKHKIKLRNAGIKPLITISKVEDPNFSVNELDEICNGEMKILIGKYSKEITGRSQRNALIKSVNSPIKIYDIGTNTEMAKKDQNSFLRSTMEESNNSIFKKTSVNPIPPSLINSPSSFIPSRENCKNPVMIEKKPLSNTSTASLSIQSKDKHKKSNSNMRRNFNFFITEERKNSNVKFKVKNYPNRKLKKSINSNSEKKLHDVKTNLDFNTRSIDKRASSSKKAKKNLKIFRNHSDNKSKKEEKSNVIILNFANEPRINTELKLTKTKKKDLVRRITSLCSKPVLYTCMNKV